MCVKTITKRIAEYISHNQISISQITLDTGISGEKLQIDTTGTLNATELLVLCDYLNIRPEEMKNY